MLDLSPDKLLMLAVVALVVLGPNRLPGAARTLGRFIGQMRAMSSSLQEEVRDALGEPHDAFTSAIGDFRPAQVRRGVRRAVTDLVAPFEADSAGVNQVRPQTTNLAPGPASAAGGSAVAGPNVGWSPAPPPDDPGFN